MLALTMPNKHSFDAEDVVAAVLEVFKDRESPLHRYKGKFINACIRYAKDKALDELKKELTAGLKEAERAKTISPAVVGKTTARLGAALDETAKRKQDKPAGTAP